MDKTMDGINNISEYFQSTTTDAPSGKPEVVTKKKRKRDTVSDDVTTLRQKARLYCTCPQQWKSVSRYSQKRMEEFITEKDFERQQQIYTSVFGFVHQLWALAADTIARGNGHVQRELESDMSLRQSIEAEGTQFVQFLSNRWRLLALTGVDVFNGKKSQRLAEPVVQEEHIEEEINDRGSEDGPTLLAGAVIPPRSTQTPEEDTAEDSAIDEI